jgi:hypothetical protein
MIIAVWTISGVIYVILHSMIYIGGVSYKYVNDELVLLASRWFYLALTILFVLALIAGVIQQAPKRQKLREELLGSLN